MTKLLLTAQYAVSDKSACPTRRQFRKWITAAIQPKLAASVVEITMRLVEENEGRKLNHEYRKKNYATNVLTFSYPTESAELPLTGDIVMCSAVIRREAAEQNKLAEAHWAHLTVHGMLHLQGFDHARIAAVKKMEKLETEILAGLGYPDPYNLQVAE